MDNDTEKKEDEVVDEVVESPEAPEAEVSEEEAPVA